MEYHSLEQETACDKIRSRPVDFIIQNFEKIKNYIGKI